MGKLLSQHPFAVLACLPGFIALVNLIAVNRELDKAQSDIQKIRKRRRAPGFAADDLGFMARVVYTIFGVVALTAVFAIIAAVGGNDRTQLTDFGIGRKPAGIEPAGVPNKSPAATETRPRQVPQVVVGRDGLVYAGYGAYVYTLLLLISRLNSAALTGKFLAVSAIRSAVAMVLGFTAADTNMFAGLSLNQGLFVLFFIGLFPSWAMDALRQKAQQAFRSRQVACDLLPLCLIDGVDDGIADRLSELGVWDIEHVANSDPLDLTAKTLYPLRRVIDWMDQAIFISYVRELIVHFRAAGVRGAIDFALLYRDAMGLREGNEDLSAKDRALLQQRALDLMKTLGEKTALSQPALMTIGRNVWEDAVVNYIWELWSE